MSKRGKSSSSVRGRGLQQNPIVKTRSMATASDSPHLMLYGYNQFADAIQDVSRSYSGYRTEHVLSKGTAHFVEAINAREELSIVFVDIATDYLVSHLVTDDWKSLVSGFHTRLTDTLLQVATGNHDLQVSPFVLFICFLR